jgi:hypothetical protein
LFKLRASPLAFGKPKEAEEFFNRMCPHFFFNMEKWGKQFENLTIIIVHGKIFSKLKVL